MNNYEYFSGALRFNPVILAIDIILIFHFFISWYLSYKKSGWLIDPWNLGLLLTYFFPFLLLYPFSSSIFNVVSVGTHVRQIQGSINIVYFITLTGYLSYFLGSRIFKISGFATPIYWFCIVPFRSTLGMMYKNVLVSRDTFKTVYFLYCSVFIIMILMAYKAGSINNPRAYFYANDKIRVIYNFTASLSGFVNGLLMARIFIFNKRIDKIYFITFLLLTLFVGSRSAALGPLIYYFTLTLFLKWKGRVKMKQFIGGGALIMALVVGLSALRAGNKAASTEAQGSSATGRFATEIFYGNSFSDLRDFAWVYSAWDGTYFYGKTYFSAFISFIPSAYSSFRTENGIGKITATLGGFKTSEHPGLRPGMYGESFLNFGILGVIIVGIILGYTARLMDHKTKEAAMKNDKVRYFVMGTSTIFVGNLAITSGFFGIYVTLILLLLLSMIKLVLNYVKQLSI
ncbi:oligosaccharide repeat unit polymerase [Mucilaginibacter lacusdianchii]|uniref:oligosaccharide repeat unit polymerase n=1 Tax=Mucilaginibacter lacusdianchii TaxID=2684211 RepID=UPI00131ACBBE|nr:oligosaccharide repeat unit polymerase [Mucilaginibacter sp. JXJ CY 39]